MSGHRAWELTASPVGNVTSVGHVTWDRLVGNSKHTQGQETTGKTEIHRTEQRLFTGSGYVRL